MITLHYRYGSQPEKSYSSTEKELVIGRSGKAPIHLDLRPDLKVSRPHARLFYDLNTWWVEDLDSKRGTILNGTKVTQPTALSPNDQLLLGDTTLRVEFPAMDTDLGPGTVEADLKVDETQPPMPPQEDKRLEIFARLSAIAAGLKGQAMLDALLAEVVSTIPNTDRGTILTIEDRDLVPRAFRPADRAAVSFTLARRVIKTRHALHWVRQVAIEGNEPISPSLYDTMSALYVPMIFNGQVIGAIHADSTKTEAAFGENDLQTLSVMATVIAQAIKSGDQGAFRKIPSVFVSYAHKDRGFVDRLAADLRRRRVKVWFDERLRGGETWIGQLATAIECTDAFILVMSPTSVASDHIQGELSTALALKKKVYPLMYQDCDVPSVIVALQYINIGADYARSLDELVESLDELVNKEETRVSPKVHFERRWSSAPTATKYILHLSDPHFGTLDNAHNWYGQLAEDLYQELNCEHIDILILSGDIANYASNGEYDAARLFLDELCQEFRVSQQRIVLVPGNHDVDWVAAQGAYHSEPRDKYKGKLPEGSFDDGMNVQIRDDALYKERFAHFSTFYKAVKGEDYPLEYDHQYILHHFPEPNLLVLGLNSAWQLDHHFTARASILTNGVTNALGQIRRNRETYRNCLRIAVWHHPLNSPFEDRITDQGFVEQLAKAGFRVVLHGHIHRAIPSLYHYDQSPDGRKIDIISAGTFGAPMREWFPGYPLQYNLLKLDGDTLTIETRRREELNGAWKPDARWTQGTGKDPLPRYEIKL